MAYQRWVMALPNLQNILSLHLPHTLPWLTGAWAALLVAMAIRDWMPLLGIANFEANQQELAVKPAQTFTVEPDRMKLSPSRSETLVVPWFGMLETHEYETPPPPDQIAASERDLHLLGISTSTSSEDSFALIRSEQGEIEMLKIGDAAESGVELAGLLPNTAILKAGDRWEKLHIGEAPAGIPEGDIHHSGAGRRITHTRRPDTSVTPASAGKLPVEHDSASQPHHTINPNLSNRHIRERMDAMMARLRQ